MSRREGRKNVKRKEGKKENGWKASARTKFEWVGRVVDQHGKERGAATAKRMA
jgi:hypothetical protein